MNVLVTGVQGRVGRTLVATLLDRGARVIGLDQRPPQASQAGARAPQDGFTFVAGTLADKELLRELVSQVNAVVHLAAYMSWKPGEEEAIWETNVRGTWNLLQACATVGSKIERFVFASSGEVYPELHPLKLPITEDHPARPRSAYGLSKLMGEEMVQYLTRVGRLPGVCLRFSHVQDAQELLNPESPFSGPRFFLGPKLAMLRASRDSSEAVRRTIQSLEEAASRAGVRETDDVLVLSTDPWGTPFRMQICDTRDIVTGILLALEHPSAVGETFNIGPEAPFDFGERIPQMAHLAQIPYIEAPIWNALYRYESSSTKAYRVLGYRPKYDPDRMISEAAAAYRTRVRTRP